MYYLNQNDHSLGALYVRMKREKQRLVNLSKLAKMVLSVFDVKAFKSVSEFRLG